MLDRIALSLRLLPALPALLTHRPTGRTTAADRLEAMARRRPDHPFVLFEGRTTSYGEMNALANRVAHWSWEMGLRTGDVVALLMENRPEYIAVWAGLAKLGITSALINSNLGGRGLRHALAAAGTRHLVIGAECADRFATTADDLESPLQVWALADGETPFSAVPGAHDLDDALADEFDDDPDRERRADLVSGDPLFYIYTSGTTGLPKAARFSHMRFLGIGDLNAFAVGLQSDDVFYCALPLYHSAGGVMLVSAALSAGATIALRRRFSASAFWDDVRRYRATHFQYIGEFCRYLMNQPPAPNDRDHCVRAIVGNGLRPDIWQAFQDRFGIETIREFYGATEGNTALMNLENKVGSVGRMPFESLSNAKIVRFDVETGEHVRDARGFCIECEPGEAGELLGKIPKTDRLATGRFEGYTSKEASDKKVLRDVFEKDDAWFRSGDLLRRDADGFFYFVDRIGDTFRWKGENVSTQEVAELLSGFEGLEMVNVYGVEVPGADGRAGMAALLLADGHVFDPQAFYRHVEENLPRYAAPLFVRLLPEQEMTGTLKIRKVGLQEQGFDPGACGDPLYLRDDDAGTYLRVTPELHAEILAGERRL